jgi:hypothetical protein
MTQGVHVAEPRINYRASIRDLLHELSLVRSSLDAQADRVDLVRRDLVFLAGLPSAGVPPASGAGPVAYNLRAVDRADGSVEFTIDGGNKFSLGPRLAEVLRFLASAEPDHGAKDTLVGWRSRADVLRFLEQRAGRSFPPSYVNNIVNLLRGAIRAAKYDRGLIQTHRQKGIRLAYKRGSEPAA